MNILGFDIGGTKCSVTSAFWDGKDIKLLNKVSCPTDLTIPPEAMIKQLITIEKENIKATPDAIGISCGGPLDSKKGIILGPPNLKGWNEVHITKQINNAYGVEVKLQNDANACAVAEWKFGAGEGCENMVFLTFGTGLGAGLILDGKLYSGTNDNAGEIGHIRLEKTGPVGFGKAGSFEGFCSGGGIAQLGIIMAEEAQKKGMTPLFCKNGISKEYITAKSIAEAARLGDETAVEIFRICGKKLGFGLSVLIDILNPEKIIIGSIFTRCQDLLLPHAIKVIEKEALTPAAKCCKILPAALGENVGDYAAVATAII